MSMHEIQVQAATMALGTMVVIVQTSDMTPGQVALLGLATALLIGITLLFD